MGGGRRDSNFMASYLDTLNEEQRKFVLHEPGSPNLLLAGAGSGKTHAAKTRVMHLITNGVESRRICVLTFTNKAANEINERVIKATNINPDLAPTMSTIHSLALRFIRKNPAGFGLGNKISPADDYDQTKLLEAIVQRKEWDINHYNLKDKIDFHRARGVGFRIDYTDEVHKAAQKAHAGYHVMDPLELEAWELFEQEKTKNNLVDFADMIYLVNRRMVKDLDWAGKVHRMYHHILMDEAQDTNIPCWQFVNNLMGPTNFNLSVIGDLAQCQPPETLVQMVDGVYIPFGHKTTFKDVPICELKDGDGAVAWTKSEQRTYNKPRPIKVSSRPYSGPMLTVHTKDGKSTRMTPNHWMWVRFNFNTADKFMVYLMYREDLGFRVGMSKFKKGDNGNKFGFGLSSRLNCEKGHKAWVLRITDTRQEAEAWEEIYSVKYGIPESVFNAAHACQNKTQDLIKLVFSYANPEGGYRCLADHGLFWDAPLTTRTDDATVNSCNKHFRGYFKTPAANLVALAPVLDVPTFGVNQCSPLSHVTIEHYDGLVYSLDVEKEHTYIADGLVVGNSIYAFNGAMPELILDYSRNWRGVTPVLYRLQRNHRSVSKVVDFANKIQALMVDSLPLQMVSHRAEQGDDTGAVRLIRAESTQDAAYNVVRQISDGRGTLRDYAILVRSSMQIREIEGALVSARIPYIVRGGRGLLQTEEIRDILAYIRLACNPNDFSALMRAASAPKRGLGEVALEKIRANANALYEGDLIRGCQKAGGKAEIFGNQMREIANEVANPLRALDTALATTMYKDYIRKKYAKDLEKVKNKLENIDRLRVMIEGMLAESDMTTEDLVFQLSMEKVPEDDERGAVTISTIHSAKGLEWKTVFVWSVVEGCLPHWRSSGDEKELTEERRLFYVAVTRARDYAYLCVPNKVPRGQNMSFAEMSRFLIELGVKP